MAKHRNTGDKDVATHLHSSTNAGALPQALPLVIAQGDGMYLARARRPVRCANQGHTGKTP